MVGWVEWSGVGGGAQERLLMPGEGRTQSTRAGGDGGYRNPGPRLLVLDLLLLRCRPGGEDVCISSLRNSQSGAARPVSVLGQPVQPCPDCHQARKKTSVKLDVRVVPPNTMVRFLLPVCQEGASSCQQLYLVGIKAGDQLIS